MQCSSQGARRPLEASGLSGPQLPFKEIWTKFSSTLWAVVLDIKEGIVNPGHCFCVSYQIPL